MGQTLSEPIVEKHTTTGEDHAYGFAVSEMQGWRLTMEDAHASVLDLNRAPPLPPSSNPDRPDDQQIVRFFAVYDGHGGSTVAKFSGDTLHFRLRSTQQYQDGDYSGALKRAFLATDEDLRTNPDFKNDPSGCTAVAALISQAGLLLVANAGDSRSVLSVNGVAKPMSEDHKPTNSGESERITRAGGFIEFGRVNGNLALSRAIGDFEFKRNKQLPPEEQVVTADPEIYSHTISSEDEFLILACDGIWDVFSSQQVVDLVRSMIGMRHPLERIAELILDRCLSPDCEWGGVGCDNMTCMIVAIYNGKTKEEWYDMICERLKNGEGPPLPDTFPDPFSQVRHNANTTNVVNRSNTSDVNRPNTLGSRYYRSQPPPNLRPEDVVSGRWSAGNNTGSSGGSLFSLAPASIIEALSRVSNAGNYDASDFSTDEPSDFAPPAAYGPISDWAPRENETNQSESNTEPALSPSTNHSDPSSSADA